MELRTCANRFSKTFQNYPIKSKIINLQRVEKGMICGKDENGGKKDESGHPKDENGGKKDESGHPKDENGGLKEKFGSLKDKNGGEKGENGGLKK